MSRALGLVAALALAAGVAGPGTAAAEQSRSQVFFRAALLEDAKTSLRVKELLRAGGFVDRAVPFGDLTGDGRADAVVRVQSGGVAGAVAVYVFSTEGARKLRAVFRSEALLRASTRIRAGTLTYRTARYAAGDPLWAPSGLAESRLEWVDGERRFRVAARVILPGPA